MGTTVQKLQRILETKTGFKDLITEKGGVVTETTTFHEYIGEARKLMEGGKVVVEEASATAVPNEGFIDKIYFNTNLTSEEIDKIITDANLPWIDANRMQCYFVLNTVNNYSGLSIIKASMFDPSLEGHYFFLSVFNDDTTPEQCYLSTATYPLSDIIIGAKPEELGYDENGWCTQNGQWNGESFLQEDLISDIDGHPVGTHNEALKQIFSTTPFSAGKQPVPNSGYVESIKFNTSLTPEEVDQIIIEGNAVDYGALVTVSQSNMIILSDYNAYSGGQVSGCMIMRQISGKAPEWIYASGDIPTMFGISFNGWNPDFNGEIIIEEDVLSELNQSGVVKPVGAQNDLLIDLMYIGSEPFKAELTGTYEAVTTDITENGEVDLTTYWDNQKMPISVNVNVPEPESSEDAIIEGSLQGIYSNKNVTKVSDYTFYKNAELTEVSFNNVETIGNYTFAENTKLKQATFNTTLTSIGSYAFYKNSSLTDFSAVINGSIGEYTFAYCNRLGNIDFSTSNITSLGQYCFSEMGGNRSDPTTMKRIDFTNSTFKTIPQYAFGGSSSSTSKHRYYEYYFPSSIKTINNYAFYYSDNCHYYFDNVVPPTLSGSSSWSSATNYEILVPYGVIETFKAATNWTSIAGYIKGYAKENTLNEFVEINGEGYSLSWYEDVKCTTKVTGVPQANKKYYCKTVEKVGFGIKSVLQDGCIVEIKDSSGKIYTQGQGVLANTELNINITPTINGYAPYIIQLNGENIEETNFSVTITENIEIIAIYYDGVNIPISPTFADNSWVIIASACRSGVAADYWSVGDTKTITLTDGNDYTIRICDMTPGRYEYTNNSEQKTNVVFEFVECLSTSYSMNDSSTNVGGWAESKMKSTHMQNIFNMLPSDLQGVIEEIQIASSVGNKSAEISTSANKLFLPSEYEIFGSGTYSTGESEGTPQYELYSLNNTNTFRIKKQNGTAKIWWLRSPGTSDTNYFCNVSTNGNAHNYDANRSIGVSPCFSI